MYAPCKMNGRHTEEMRGPVAIVLLRTDYSFVRYADSLRSPANRICVRQVVQAHSTLHCMHEMLPFGQFVDKVAVSSKGRKINQDVRASMSENIAACRHIVARSLRGNNVKGSCLTDLVNSG